VFPWREATVVDAETELLSYSRPWRRARAGLEPATSRLAPGLYPITISIRPVDSTCCCGRGVTAVLLYH
jgi:hypothetical protein